MSVPDFVVDLLLPETDRTVAIQWIVMTLFWTAVFVAARHQSRDLRTFLFGLAMVNLAWFAARTIH